MQMPPLAWATILASWAPSTANNYECVVKRWLTFTDSNEIHPLTPTVMQCMKFLMDYLATGVGHSALNTTRSCLSCFISIGGTPLGEIPIIARLLKGTRRLRPPKGKVKHVWDPVPVLHHLQAWGPIPGLTLEQLTRRTMLLFLLATGQRLQALHLMRREDIQWEDTLLRIQYTERLKTNDPTDNPLRFMFTQHEEQSLCIYSHLKAYVAREETLPAAPYVFSTVKLPTVRASSTTISRQVKTALREAGVGEEYTAYSARHASTSAAARNNVPLNTILQSAGWTRETTFSRFYNRPLVTPPTMEETNFIPRLLE